MKSIPWNVNVSELFLNSGFEEILMNSMLTFFCLQETKMQEGQADFHQRAITNITAMRRKRVTQELRFLQRRNHQVSRTESMESIMTKVAITLEYDDLPYMRIRAKRLWTSWKRIDYRMKYEDDLRAYMTGVRQREACRILWWPQRCTSGNRPQEPEE